MFPQNFLNKNHYEMKFINFCIDLECGLDHEKKKLKFV